MGSVRYARIDDFLERMPDQLRSAIRGELVSGEQIVWIEQPIPSLYARRMLHVVYFGIPWTAAVLFVVSRDMAKLYHLGWSQVGFDVLFDWLFNLGFFVAGLAMLASSYLARRYAGRLAYLVTNRRAIVVTAGLRGSFSVRSIWPRQLSLLHRRQHVDGSGDLVFLEAALPSTDEKPQPAEVGFFAIRDVKAVAEKVNDLIRY